MYCINGKSVCSVGHMSITRKCHLYGHMYDILGNYKYYTSISKQLGYFTDVMNILLTVLRSEGKVLIQT